VKAAQVEQFIDIPPQLELPWRYLCRHFGLYSQGGNVTSNYFCNVNDQDRLVYPININMSEVIKTAEYHFGYVFPAIEKAVSDQKDYKKNWLADPFEGLARILLRC
jgi:hypothetical protein